MAIPTKLIPPYLTINSVYNASIIKQYNHHRVLTCKRPLSEEGHGPERKQKTIRKVMLSTRVVCITWGSSSPGGPSRIGRHSSISPPGRWAKECSSDWRYL